jgi:hypothetical protein
MKVFVTLILALGLISVLKAKSSDQLSELLQNIRQNPQMEASKKIQLLDDFIKQSKDSDSALTASLLQQCYLIPGPRDMKTAEIEKSLTRLGAQRPNSWQSKFVEFTLVNLLHTDGQHERVIQMGEQQLAPGYFEIFDSSTDPQLLLLKIAYPLNSEIMRHALRHQLAIAYDRLGNTSRAAEIRSDAFKALLSGASEKTEKAPADVAQPATATVQQKPIPQSIPEAQQSPVPESGLNRFWILGLAIMILAGVGVWRFRLNDRL